MAKARSTADRTAPARERTATVAAARARKTPAKAAPDAVRVAQPHGGALLRGGVKGNRGGLGNLPSQLRAMARDGAAKGLALAAKIAAGEAIPQSVVNAAGEVSDADMRPGHGEIVRAVDVLVKHGLGPQLAVDDARARVAATHDLLKRELPPELFARIAPQLAEVWA